MEHAFIKCLLSAFVSIGGKKSAKIFAYYISFPMSVEKNANLNTIYYKPHQGVEIILRISLGMEDQTILGKLTAIMGEGGDGRSRRHFKGAREVVLLHFLVKPNPLWYI